MDFIVQALGFLHPHEDKFTKIENLPRTIPDKDAVMKKRRKYIGSKCQIFYKDEPLLVSKASMQYVFDETGRKYIDCISNVQHVGHCNPKVVEAISKQLAESTCNLRFVGPKLGECAEKILKTLPGLDSIIFCNSGSEANDLALRLARDFTKKEDVIVIDHAYHGHVTTTMQMSPYKFDHGCSIRKPEWVHVAPCPDTYRGKYRLSDGEREDPQALIEAGKRYSDDVRKLIENAKENGRSVGAYFAESLLSCGGQVIPPPEYFCDVTRHVRANGGLVVIDEVQTGFGRIGEAFWAHQLYNDDFRPDIVTMGKPMGNGFPVSAVATRKEIADSLGGNVDYFNTYGGNPVACSAVLSVLEVMESDDLIEHSKIMGKLFKNELTKLKEKHKCIGDVRGVGMFWGIDIVKDRLSREVDTELANILILKLKQKYAVLLSADGPYSNILKIKPPLCFNENDLKKTIAAIDDCLQNLQK